MSLDHEVASHSRARGQLAVLGRAGQGPDRRAGCGADVQAAERTGDARGDATGAEALRDEAATISARAQQEYSFAGRLGGAMQPAFAPLGLDAADGDDPARGCERTKLEADIRQRSGSPARRFLLLQRPSRRAVLACGLDLVYPPEHANLAQEIMRSGALIGDYPLGTQPRSEFFPRRNRIIAGLALGVVVIEAAPRSGSLITARIAQDIGREVFAVPGSPLDQVARGRTTLVIAHRLSTIRNAQRIVVLTESGIAEQGTHAELIRMNGTYANLYNVQARI